MSSPKDKFFPEYGGSYSFAAIENQVLDFWKGAKVFERIQQQGKEARKSGGQEFFFYDGPPFATGLPHYGHILAGTIKDVIPRYWTMLGYSVPRRFGWDCHGLPIEFEIEKTLNLSGSLAIQAYGVGPFNEACRGTVQRYAKEWRQTVERMGRWIDMDHDYKTMDPDFMESVWWVFKQLWDKGLIYEGKKVVPYSWRLTAPLSNFEASLNYKDVQDPAITALLPLQSGPKNWLGNTALAIWTTTPWTLPSNLGVAIHADPAVVTYARYELAQPLGAITHVIMATGRAEFYGLDKAAHEDVANADLLGLFYEPFFKVFDDAERKAQKAFRVLDGSSFVSATDGTGIVHMAPGFGEDDFYLCQKNGISVADPTDMQANFTSEIARDERLSSIQGVFVKDADKHIIKMLKESGRLLKQETLQHAYPFCERSDTPLIYKAISSWFVKVEAIKDQMIANNKQIRWVPGHIKEGRFGKWLENARDWCISRNRFWGTPIPVWKCSKCSHFEVVASRADLAKLAGRTLDDLHKHFVDEVKGDCPKCSAKGTLSRTPEVLDCWFESGSMPYAQAHYPFENREDFEQSFPADFIGEGLDQTRGWFYTLTVLSTALFNKPAFKNCVVNGIVLAEDGRKMSKRLKNYPDPAEIFEKHGADALRLYLMQSPAMHGEELRFSEKGLLDLMRAVMLPLWNAYGFFSSYANIDDWNPARLKSAPPAESRTMLDRWILARAVESEIKVHEALQRYELADVAPVLIDFIDDLTNWYIRLSRDRFWADASRSAADKDAAYATLWTALNSFSLLLAPGLPFLAETLAAALEGKAAADLKTDAAYKSVHERRLSNPADLKLSAAHSSVLEQISLGKRIIVLGRSLRGEAKIGLRQPLPKLRVAGLSKHDIENLSAIRELILNEVNVKELELVARAADLVEESVKPNHKVLGKKVGPLIKEIQNALLKWGHEDILKFESQGFAELCGVRLVPEDLQIVRKAKPGRFAMSGAGLVAELDTSISPELKREGLMREIVNRVQQARKDKKLHLADRIRIVSNAPAGSVLAEILAAEARAPGLISSETLCTQFMVDPAAAASAASQSLREDFGSDGTLEFYIEKV